MYIINSMITWGSSFAEFEQLAQVRKVHGGGRLIRTNLVKDH